VARFPNLAEQPVELQLRLGLDGDHGAVKVQLRRLLGDGVSSEAYAIAPLPGEDGELQQSDKVVQQVSNSKATWVRQSNNYSAFRQQLQSGSPDSMLLLMPGAATRHAAYRLPAGATHVSFAPAELAAIGASGYADWRHPAGQQNAANQGQCSRMQLLGLLAPGVAPVLYAVGRIKLERGGASCDPIEQTYGSDLVVLIVQRAVHGTADSYMQRLQGDAPYPPVWFAAEVARQLVDKLSTAYGKTRLIHCDIKPVSGAPPAAA